MNVWSVSAFFTLSGKSHQMYGAEYEKARVPNVDVFKWGILSKLRLVDLRVLTDVCLCIISKDVMLSPALEMERK